MFRTCLVFLGDFSDENIPWDEVGSHVGWTARHQRNIDGLREESGQYDVAGVFIESPAEGLTDVLRLTRIQELVPNARLVICRPLDLNHATELDAIGAFHAIARPLNLGELRQSIGFVWESWCRRASAARSSKSADAPALRSVGAA
jgi:hypothetical protein